MSGRGSAHKFNSFIIQMQLSFEQADFLMQLITDYVAVNGEVSYSDLNGNEWLTYPEIEELWNKIQEEKLSQVVG